MQKAVTLVAMLLAASGVCASAAPSGQLSGVADQGERKVVAVIHKQTDLNQTEMKAGSQAGSTKGILLEDLTWQEAEKVLTPETIVVIPLGAAAKEHGPHLKLKNDWLIAEYLKQRIMSETNVVVAPTVNYHFYPAFVEYPGSVTLSQDTACNMIVDICRSLAHFGPRRFYILNTGVSTVRALQPAKEKLAALGIQMTYSDLNKLHGDGAKQVSKQEGGTHADEIETSMMLYMAPETVDMSKAAKDYDPAGQGGLTRTKSDTGTYSPTGIFGDATLGTYEKGKVIVEEMVAGIQSDIETLRKL
jgi:creatinine amidohydrolase